MPSQFWYQNPACYFRCRGPWVDGKSRDWDLELGPRQWGDAASLGDLECAPWKPCFQGGSANYRRALCRRLCNHLLSAGNMYLNWLLQPFPLLQKDKAFSTPNVLLPKLR